MVKHDRFCMRRKSWMQTVLMSSLTDENRNTTRSHTVTDRDVLSTGPFIHDNLISPLQWRIQDFPQRRQPLRAHLHPTMRLRLRRCSQMGCKAIWERCCRDMLLPGVTVQTKMHVIDFEVMSQRRRRCPAVAGCKWALRGMQPSIWPIRQFSPRTAWKYRIFRRGGGGVPCTSLDPPRLWATKFPFYCPRLARSNKNRL